MNHPTRKLIICLVLSCALVAALWLSYTVMNTVYGVTDDQEAEMKIEGFMLTLSNLLEADTQASDDLSARVRANMELLTLPLKMKVESEGDAAIRKYEDGCVVRKDADRISLPEDDSGIPVLDRAENPGDAAPLNLGDVQPFENEGGAFWARMKDSDGGELMLCVYRQLEKGYYGVYYMPASEVKEFLDSRVDLDGVLSRSLGCLDRLLDGLVLI